MMPLLRTLSGAMALAVLCLPAAAHNAPSGWSYSAACCDSKDCHPAAPGEVETTLGGYFIPATREMIPFSDRRVKPSGDGTLHRCSYSGFPAAGTICLYVPAGS